MARSEGVIKRRRSGRAATQRLALDREREFFRDTFLWMFLGVLVTTGVAVWMKYGNGGISALVDHHPLAVVVIIIVQLVVVIALAAAYRHIPAPLAATLFLAYAALVGLTLAIILEAYTTANIISAFGGAAGLFFGMALWGFTTKRDITGAGGFFVGALIGLIIASVIFIFVGGTVFNLILGIVGVFIFCGLTAYDIQVLRQMAGELDDKGVEKLAIYGALHLYLDFLNLFVSLLRILRD